MVYMFTKNMDYLFYSLQTLLGRDESSKASALCIIAIDISSILISTICLIYGVHKIPTIVLGILVFIIYFLLIKFFNCEKAIRKIERKSKFTKIISHMVSVFITIFAFWLWIFHGFESLRACF